MKIKELTISQLARYLLSLNDEFKKIHDDWNEAREKSRTNLILLYRKENKINFNCLSVSL